MPTPHGGQTGQGGHAGHMPATSDRQALIYSGLLTGGYFILELAIGLWTGSVSVTSDAFHTFSAVGDVLIALVAQQFSERPASTERTFGWGRAEIIGALFNGVFLTIMALYVFYMGAMRLSDPMELSTNVMLLAAAGGIITELISFWLLYKRQKENLNIRGAFWHILQTFVGSLIIIVSALVIRFTGFLEIDPILGMAFGVVLLWASWSIIKSALNILLQSTPDDLDLDAMVEDLRNIDGVEGIHHVHAWSVTSGRNLVSTHLRVDDYARDGERVLREASSRLKDRFNIYFSTLQIEDERVPGETDASDIDITTRQEASSHTH